MSESEKSYKCLCSATAPALIEGKTLRRKHERRHMVWAKKLLIKPPKAKWGRKFDFAKVKFFND